ncbi:hypothetical protein CLOP_g864 [Closterium sp. NIES-67]|nr:hypothetical protein CLOP_g864 [Closterium sp. NIES-67]
MEGDAEQLCSAWTEREVRKAFLELACGKSPGQDGLPKELVEAHWDLLGKPVMEAARSFEVIAELSAAVKTAATVLLHKKGPIDWLQNYHPISLLNTLYKVVAKVMANRAAPAQGEIGNQQEGYWAAGVPW